MIAKYLWIIGSLIILILGGLHLLYTFFSNRLLPKRVALISEMKGTILNITKETTVWKAWIGFNASHSIGAIYIGIINIFMSIQFFDLLHANYFFYFFNISIIGFYLWLAKAYWFKIPFIGILITLCCYLISAMLTLATN